MTSRSAFRPVGAATPLVEATFGIAAAALFSATSAIRGARTFHPIGAAFEATLTVEQPAGVGVKLLDTPGTHDAVVRLSRGVGLRESWPDILGLALRVLDAHGSGAHQDLLLVTSGERPIARHLFVPTTSFDGIRFSSVLPYRLGDRTVLFGARVDDVDGPRLLRNDIERDDTTNPVRFTIDIATLRGAWEQVARLDIGRQLPGQTADALRFNPANTGGGFRPVGVLQAVRRLSYAASQAGRSARQS
ncbi:MAG TPA: hypothetical protein VLN74_10365 [Ilumatobacteraceae bacterium]|nr:hypothetical protein [Ilumatobacteraceae bacterium]